MVVEHFGWPDHHPPPFEYIEPLLESIHNHRKSNEKATAVLHCKGALSLQRCD
jgi:protein-tyrosine phosphatase